MLGISDIAHDQILIKKGNLVLKFMKYVIWSQLLINFGRCGIDSEKNWEYNIDFEVHIRKKKRGRKEGEDFEKHGMGKVKVTPT